MKNTVSIKLAKIIAPSISFRNTATKLFDALELKELESLCLDFKDVEFVSRSFTHQLLLEISRLKSEYSISVSIENTSSLVNKTIEAVEKPKSKSIAKKVKVINLSKDMSFDKFLMSI